MRFAIIGAGAVGGYFGARLIRAGQDVTFLARGRHLSAIRERGLKILSPSGDFTVQARAESEPTRVGPVDVVMLAVKTYDNASALPTVRALLSQAGPGAAVLPLQNGVDSPGELAALVGEQAVLGGSAYISTAVTEPGVITQTGTHQRITLGECFGDTSRLSPRVEALRDALASAGIHVQAVADARVSLWDKLIFLAPFAGLLGCARLPLGPLWSQPASRETYLAAAAEVARVATAEGIAIETRLEQLERTVDQLPPDIRASLLVDLEQGKPIEVEALLGSVVRRGRAAGVPTPVMATFYGVLKPHEHGRRQG
ncbi:MAG TPA: 2-dehydropantoate 2-reductase [Myxococcaceae bacterium]|jgi:2-dehydropantoate 2-reductase